MLRRRFSKSWGEGYTTRMAKFIPSAEELKDVKREFRFFPADADQAVTLSKESVAAFNRDGYLKGIRIFSPVEIAAIRTYFDDLLARTIAAG